MQRLLSALLITVLTVIGFVMYQQQDVGYIQLRFAGVDFETSLLVLLAAILVLLFVLSMLARVIGAIASVFALFGSRRRQRLQQKARQALTRGLMELAEGRFDRAEKLLLGQIRHSDYPLLAYLGAARAAQQQGAHERRDKYLRLAHEAAPEAETAIRLTQAELQLAHRQYEQALATLRVLAEQVPGHAYVLKLLARCYQQLKDWKNLRTLIPGLKKHGVFDTEHNLQIEIAVWDGLLHDCAEREDARALLALWAELPRHLRPVTRLTQTCARLLVQLDAADEAEHLLRQALSNHWDDGIMQQYAELEVPEDNKALATAEKWLQEHPHNAHLLYALGNMCMQRSLWGKAKNYYEASLAIQPLPETFLQLARLLETRMHNTEAAQEYYRQGLHRLAGQACETPPPALPGDAATVEAKPSLKVV